MERQTTHPKQWSSLRMVEQILIVGHTINAVEDSHPPRATVTLSSSTVSFNRQRVALIQQ